MTISEESQLAEEGFKIQLGRSVPVRVRPPVLSQLSPSVLSATRGSVVSGAVLRQPAQSGQGLVLLEFHVVTARDVEDPVSSLGSGYSQTEVEGP